METRDAFAEVRAFWKIATPAYYVVAAMTVAIALQSYGFPSDLYRCAIIAIIALVGVAVAIAVTDLGLLLWPHGGPDALEFIREIVSGPLPRAIAVFFIAHFISTLPWYALPVAVVIAVILEYGEWSSGRRR